jgi:membrane protease YdiL (CAAX protease family)
MMKSLRRYAETTRTPFVAALLVFPVYFLYQLGLSLTPGIRNGADFITDLLLMLRRWQPEALWGLAVAIVVAYGVLLWRFRKKKGFSPSLFGLVALEGAAQGILMFVLVNQVMRAVLLGGDSGRDYPLHVDVILSLGAGFHEELVFRVLLFGGIVWIGRRLLKEETLWLVLAAAVVSSLIFSAIHYVGPLGDPLHLGSFVFRFLAGCYFAAVYRFRGFAVAVYTHAIYDIGIFALT